MTTEEFVQAIKVILKSALAGLLKTIMVPPGRRPAPELIQISHFYNKLNEEDKRIFSVALELAAKQSACNILSVLDGAVSIEPIGEKGKLELFYSDGKTTIKINDTGKPMLNELFRQEREEA